MTASEFAGHIDDIGSEYDMIYISDAKTEADHSLITGGGNLRYVHVGSAVSKNLTTNIFLNYWDNLIRII